MVLAPFGVDEKIHLGGALEMNGGPFVQIAVIMKPRYKYIKPDVALIDGVSVLRITRAPFLDSKGGVTVVFGLIERLPPEQPVRMLRREVP